MMHYIFIDVHFKTCESLMHYKYYSLGAVVHGPIELTSLQPVLQTSTYITYTLLL